MKTWTVKVHANGKLLFKTCGTVQFTYSDSLAMFDLIFQVLILDIDHIFIFYLIERLICDAEKIYLERAPGDLYLLS